MMRGWTGVSPKTMIRWFAATNKTNKTTATALAPHYYSILVSLFVCLHRSLTVNPTDDLLFVVVVNNSSREKEMGVDTLYTWICVCGFYIFSFYWYHCSLPLFCVAFQPVYSKMSYVCCLWAMRMAIIGDILSSMGKLLHPHVFYCLPPSHPSNSPRLPIIHLSMTMFSMNQFFESTYHSSFLPFRHVICNIVSMDTHTHVSLSWVFTSTNNKLQQTNQQTTTTNKQRHIRSFVRS